MKYYVLEFDLQSEDPNEGKILFHTESDSLTEAMKSVTVRENCEYEIVTELDILEEIQKYYDCENIFH